MDIIFDLIVRIIMKLSIGSMFDDQITESDFVGWAIVVFLVYIFLSNLAYRIRRRRSYNKEDRAKSMKKKGEK
ncbi:hypothetical protein Kalk_20830 [Ketobacter alkanivorans]|uniref:Uncharacterized protein n=1 Tax=Ketobacter alkanivorans TaxID=1917421 RepID=A0A2K9LV33_9GAMM|nr:hypothetical protein Kalk_20830 [Ketobacter alkanivorans]